VDASTAALWTLVLAVACTCTAAATWWLTRRPAAEPSADHAPLASRVDALELERPKFIAEMNALVEQCEDLLDRTERKRKSIAASKSREPEDAPGQPEGESIELLAQRDPVRARALILAEARQRRGF
jgi:hypothetical protein